jgi:hypothetical protein
LVKEDDLVVPSVEVHLHLSNITKTSWKRKDI